MPDPSNPESPAPGLYLLYDGDCALCASIVGKLKAWRRLEGITVLPLQSADWASPSLREQGRTQVLLIELTGETSNPAEHTHARETTWGGIDALIELCQRKPGYMLLGRCLRWPILAPLVHALYRMVAYNRRLLSPVSPQSLPCACDPPEDAAMTQQFYSLLVALILISLLTFAAGASLQGSHRVTSNACWSLFNRFTLAGMLGWLGAALLLKGLYRKQARQLLPQTLISLTGGSLFCLLAGLLLPTITFHAAHGGLTHQSFILLALGLGIQTIGSTAPLVHRFRILAAPTWSPWLWLAAYLGVTLASLKLLA